MKGVRQQYEFAAAPRGAFINIASLASCVSLMEAGIYGKQGSGRIATR